MTFSTSTILFMLKSLKSVTYSPCGAQGGARVVLVCKVCYCKQGMEVQKCAILVHHCSLSRRQRNHSYQIDIIELHIISINSTPMNWSFPLKYCLHRFISIKSLWARRIRSISFNLAPFGSPLSIVANAANNALLSKSKLISNPNQPLNMRC